MKEKILNFLVHVNHVFTVVCISSLIIEVILLFFFSDAAARHPKGFLDRTNIILIFVFFFSLVMVIFLPEEKRENTPSENDIKEPTFFNRKIRSRGVEIYLVRLGFFALLGFICGVLFILSGLLWFDEWGIYGKWFRILSVLFILIYPSIRGIFIKNYLRWSICIPEMVSYCIGGMGGLAVGIAVVIVMALCVILPALFKFIHDWGFLFYLYF